MKIVVTGGSGRVGRYVVRELVEAGHQVTNLDRIAPAERLSRTLLVDLTQAGEVYEALAGAEAVVHLGAWPDAGIVPDTRTYGDNAQSTFNVFQACADLGIRRIISASSAQVYGFAGAPPLYAPVDEAHPLRPVNSYALSKVVGERVAAYFISNRGLTILSFRLMGIRPPDQLDADIERIIADPAGDARLLWTRTDARDAALACRLAVEQEQVAPGPYNITGAQIVLAEESLALLRRYHGEKTEIRGSLSGQQSPLSCARAEQAFGYRPRYLWSESQRYLEAS